MLTNDAFLKGLAIHAKDGELGTVDQFYFDDETWAIRYLIVDTGGWLSSKKFIVPPEKLRASAKHEKDFRVNLTKEQIESFPPYDSASIASEEGWADYEKRYRSKWETGPVMHREGTDRNVTPTTQQQIAAGSGTLASSGDADTLQVTPIRTDAEMEISASGPTLNWTTFEDKLRQRREDVLESSINLAKQSSGESPRRKAS